MYRKLRIAYFAHSVRSDWNNGNAHFLRGLIREMDMLGHSIVAFEPSRAWSICNLQREPLGEESLKQFIAVYPELQVQLYEPSDMCDKHAWRCRLRGIDVVIVHEWNTPELAALLLELRSELRYRLLFHDTHHRATSSPEQIRLFGLQLFDGILAFGEVLRNIYRMRFGLDRVWTLHEAADVNVFRPDVNVAKTQDVVWIGNWGDDERSEEIRQMVLFPASQMPERRFRIYGVRYPEAALRELNAAHVCYCGYLPNLDAPQAYAASRVALHVPRQPYARSMPGIPTIRVFEALACGIPLISAPWQDAEGLFRREEFVFVQSAKQMRDAIERVLSCPGQAAQQAAYGLRTIRERHTCAHRAQQLTEICDEVLQ